MDAEKLIAALEARADIAVSATELDDVVELMIRHTDTLWRGEYVTVDHGTPYWSSASARGGRPIRPGPGEDGDDPAAIARVICNAVAPVPREFRTSGGSAYL